MKARDRRLMDDAMRPLAEESVQLYSLVKAYLKETGHEDDIEGLSRRAVERIGKAWYAAFSVNKLIEEVDD